MNRAGEKNDAKLCGGAERCIELVEYDAQRRRKWGERFAESACGTFYLHRDKREVFQRDSQRKKKCFWRMMWRKAESACGACDYFTVTKAMCCLSNVRFFAERHGEKKLHLEG